MALIDSITRLIPGVLGAAASLEDESYTPTRTCLKPLELAAVSLGLMEYPQYTRPADFSPKRGIHWRVPEILLAGDHAAIAAWREAHRASRDT